MTRGGAAAARWAHNPKVGGSNPPPATRDFNAGTERFRRWSFIRNYQIPFQSRRSLAMHPLPREESLEYRSVSPQSSLSTSFTPNAAQDANAGARGYAISAGIKCVFSTDPGARVAVYPHVTAAVI